MKLATLLTAISLAALTLTGNANAQSSTNYERVLNPKPITELYPKEKCEAGEAAKRFLQNMKTEKVGGRLLKLLDDFDYRDEDCRIWRAPKNFVSDGASIPQAFWSLIGGPWDGVYSNAAVIHDYECVRRTTAWEQVHKLFFRAMLAAGTEPLRAKLMYAAVYHCGPKWDAQGRPLPTCTMSPTSLFRLYREIAERSKAPESELKRKILAETQSRTSGTKPRIEVQADAPEGPGVDFGGVEKTTKEVSLDEIEGWK